MDIRLTPAPLSLHRLFKSSDWSLCQFHCSSIPSQSYVTNYPALSVLVSVIQSLHQCFQHVHLTLMSVWLCLSCCPSPLLVCGWNLQAVIHVIPCAKPSLLCCLFSCLFFLSVLHFLSMSKFLPTFFFFSCNCSDFTLFGVQDKMAQISVTLHFACILNHLVSCSFFSQYAFLSVFR